MKKTYHFPLGPLFLIVLAWNVPNGMYLYLGFIILFYLYWYVFKIKKNNKW